METIESRIPIIPEEMKASQQDSPYHADLLEWEDRTKEGSTGSKENDTKQPGSNRE